MNTHNPSDGDDAGAAAPATPRLTGWPLFGVALCVVLLVQAAFVLSYVGALHAPKPHDLPLGLVGASPLAVAVGTQVSLQTKDYASKEAAVTAIDEREITAALVSGPDGATLIVAPAAGPAAASALSTGFGTAAAALGQRLTVEQVHTLPSGDVGGIVPFLAVMALVVGGYLSATIAMAFGGAATRHGRLAALGVVAALGALLTDTIAGPVLDALPPSKFLVLWALFTLVMMAVAFATAALQTVIGAAGTLVVVVVFVIFGAPAAGGTVPSDFLPGFWRVVGPYLPAGAGTEVVRNTVYFNGNAIATPVIVLLAYLLLGAVAVILIRRRRPAATTAEVEAATAAAAAIV